MMNNLRYLFRQINYLKQLIAVTLLTIDAKNATAVVSEVTSIDGIACFIVSCTNLVNPPLDIFCCLLCSQILQNIKASSEPIPNTMKNIFNTERKRKINKYYFQCYLTYQLLLRLLINS